MSTTADGTGRVVTITGASSGIGAATARDFAARGFRVARKRAGGVTLPRRRVTRDLVLLLAGVVAMSVGGRALVEGTGHLASSGPSQARLGLTLVGFATAFELLVLAVPAARRGATEVVIAAVAGSFAYNATMTLGASASRDGVPAPRRSRLAPTAWTGL